MLSSVLPASKKTARITSLSLPGPDAGRPSGYTTRVYALGLAVRFIHLAGIILLVGEAATFLLAGRSDRPTAVRWESRVLALARAVAVLTLAAGLAGLAAQTATLEGRAAAALEPAALARVLGETQSGHVWLVRQSLLLLLAAFLAVRWDVERGIDWRAARGEAALLGAPALALADARAYAVLAARRFSRGALVCVLALVLTGTLNAATQVATVAGLVGTTYGRLLVLKLALLLPILALAAVNRRRHLPQLGGDGATVGRPAMRRLARFAGCEAALALLLLAVVAVMSATPPARHEAPHWPFAFRLTTASLD